MSPNADPASALRNFAENRSESAFAEIVAVHGGLVFASAFRRTGDRELAEEITQSVFAILAHKASSVARHSSLTGWLFTTTKFESAKAMRSRHRYQRKITALAETLDDPKTGSPEASNELLPHLDDLLDQLPKHDRELLLARFVEEKAFRELARQTGKTEAACKMRIKRTLEKLRISLTARGATVSVASLSLVLSVELSRALPVPLVASLPAQALATATSLKTGGINFSHLIHSMNSVKTSTVALAVVAIGVIPIVWQHLSSNDLRRELAVIQSQVPTASGLTQSGLRRSGSNSSRSQPTPIRRLLTKATVPATGEEFLEVIFKSQMGGGMDTLLKVIIPLSQANEAQIESLIAEVEASDKFPTAKKSGLQMLLSLSGRAQENPGKVMERTIASGGSSRNLEREMSIWLEKDPKAALAWFRDKTVKGELVGAGLRDSPEGYLARSVVRKLIEGDREAALALVEDVSPLNREKVIDALAPLLAGEGRSSWPEAHRLMNSLTDVDLRMKTTGSALLHVRDRAEVRNFLAGLELNQVETSAALAKVASRHIIPDSELVSEKMAWLAEVATPAQLDEAVKRAILPLSRRVPDEVARWIESLDRGSVRDAALEGQASSLSNEGKFEQALERVQMITDPDRREISRERVFENLEINDPEAAKRLALPKNVD